ncbi:MAG: hypothetical protein FWE80_02355 [Oscillospiraceae bacterium]|nr:hypothetical protein [Oscillospiraceae bacterium]
MYKKKAIIITAISLFALISALLLVFILTKSDGLPFRGTVTLSPDAKLRLVDGVIYKPVDEDKAKITVSNDGLTATITGVLKQPGNYVMFFFDVENVGAADAKITSLSLTNNDPSKINIDGTFKGLDGIVIPKNESSEDSSYIYVHWENTDEAEANEECTFSIVIDSDAVS